MTEDTNTKAVMTEKVSRESKIGRRIYPYIDLALSDIMIERLHLGYAVTVMKDKVKYCIYQSDELNEEKAKLRKQKLEQKKTAQRIKELERTE